MTHHENGVKTPFLYERRLPPINLLPRSHLSIDPDRNETHVYSLDSRDSRVLSKDSMDFFQIIKDCSILNKEITKRRGNLTVKTLPHLRGPFKVPRGTFEVRIYAIQNECRPKGLYNFSRSL